MSGLLVGRDGERSVLQIQCVYYDLNEGTEVILLRLISDSNSGGKPNTTNDRSKIQIHVEDENSDVQAQR